MTDLPSLARTIYHDARMLREDIAIPLIVMRLELLRVQSERDGVHEAATCLSTPELTTTNRPAMG